MVHGAFEQSAIEFLRFKGGSQPEGYKVDLPAQQGNGVGLGLVRVFDRVILRPVWMRDESNVPNQDS